MLVDIGVEYNKLKNAVNRKLGEDEKRIMAEEKNVDMALKRIASKVGFKAIFEDVHSVEKRAENIKLIQELTDFIERM